jgi:isopenicillin-N epimerase
MNFASSYSSNWLLDPEIVFLNHGSFGACPKPVLAYQDTLRQALERKPIRFLDGEYYALLAEARTELAGLVGAQPDDLAFVPNATTGVNTVLRSLRFQPGDEILVADQAYNACKNAVRFAAEQNRANVVLVELPFPVSGGDELVDAILRRVTKRTKLALIDHITSPTALVLPIDRIVAELARRGVDTLVDGAHAPGMVALDIDRLGAAYYTGNCHKWLCAPKGAAFLHVRRDKQELIHPLTISHGYNRPLDGATRFRREFDWTGTFDPTPYLCVPTAIRFMGGLLPGGWPALMEHNHELALRGRDILCAALGVPPPCPDDLLGSMAAAPLPDGDAESLQRALFERHRIEIPVICWPAPPKRLIRISAQIYNAVEQYTLLANAIRESV